MSDCSTIVEVLLERGERQPDKTAYVFLSSRGRDEASVSYAGLGGDVRALAQWVLQTCRPGDRALIVFQPGLEYIKAFYACLCAGVVPVPAYPPSRSGGTRAFTQLLKIARDAGVSCLLTASDLSASLIEQFTAAGGEIPPVIDVDRLDLTAVDKRWQPDFPSAKDLAFLQYTSGSTGDPKGVMVTHANLMANSGLICKQFAHTEHSVGVIWLPPYHDMGLIGGILQPMYVGFTTVLMPPVSFAKSPLLWLKTISRFGATTSGGPDFAYAQCVKDIAEKDLAGLDLSTWRVAFTGAEPIRPQTLDGFARKFQACGFDRHAFYPCYGLAESTLFVTGSAAGSGHAILELSRDRLSAHCAERADSPDADNTMPVVSCGNADQPGHRLRIVDVETLSPLPDDQVGEVWVHGPSVARGYWNKPDHTAATFNAQLPDGDGPYLRTGDLGFVRDGQLYVTGRAKDLIIIRGRNHHPTDIEATLRGASASFAKAGAISAFAKDEALVIVCEAPAEVATQAHALFDCATKAIAAHHGLRVAEMVMVKSRSLPRTSSGKLRRHLCRQQHEQDRLTVLARVGASTTLARAQVQPTGTLGVGHPDTQRSGLDAAALREWMRQAIAERLGRPPSSVDVDIEFFQLGLDSMDVVRLSATLEERLQQPVEPSLFFDHPTVQRLTDHFVGGVAVPTAHVGDASAGATREVGIVGVSCRFPGAENKDAFWALLRDGRHAIGRVPDDRWDAARPTGTGASPSPWGGFISDVAEFDAAFFGISPREAAFIDPQQRLLLELAFDALQDAGLSPKHLKGSRTGVFVGISSSDYSLLHTDPAQVGPYSGIGNAHSVAANRISYFFDFQGPSVAVDTACSSSLVALHLACRALQANDCDLALVGGVNLMLTPHLHVIFSEAKMLANDGLCKPFDDRADGYVRGEGAGFVVLRRVADARRSGQRVLARVLGSAVNQDGRTNGLTAPSGRSQEAVIREALERAGVRAGEVSYVEAHGTGTKLGDPIEMRALGAAYGADPRERPLLVGSVKSNIGHLEAAAGIASIIKMVLSLQRDVLPASLHFKKLNQQVASRDAMSVQVCSASVPWIAPSERRLVGVSSFGFGGTNCHVLLGGVEAMASTVAQPVGVSVLTLSAESRPSMQQLLERYAQLLEQPSIDDVRVLAHHTNLSRADLSLRWAAPATDRKVLLRRLRSAASDLKDVGKGKRTQPKLLFAFSGQGAQQLAMGSLLHDAFPVFREALNRCEGQLSRHWKGMTLGGVLRGERDPKSGETALMRTEFAQPALFAFQYALLQLWQSFGVQPAAVIGHSLGEYSAACAAGVLRWEDALDMLVARGRLMQSVRQDGRMLAVGANEARTRLLIDKAGASLEIAAINAPTSVVVVGRDREIERLAQHCAVESVPFRALQTQQAFHSADLDPMLEALEQHFRDIRHAPPCIPLYGNLHGERMSSADEIGAAYWRRHSRQPVLFGKGLAAAVRDGHDVVLEIGPDATLSSLVGMAYESGEVVPIPSGRRGIDELSSLNEALAAVYVEGVNVDWSRIHGNLAAAAIDLPSYPFNRSRYWLTNHKPDEARASNAALAIETSDERRGLTAMKNERPESPLQDNTLLANTVCEVRQLVASLLAVDEAQVDCDAPFVEIGADSLMLMSAIQAVEDKYGISLTVNQLFDHAPTINALAAFIMHQRRDGAQPVTAPQAPQTTDRTKQPRPVDLKTLVPALRSPGLGSAGSLAERLLAGQLDLMSRQLQLVSVLHSGGDLSPSMDEPQAQASMDPPQLALAQPPEASAAPESRAHVWGRCEASSNSHGLPAWARQPTLISDATTPALKRYVDQAIQAYVERTATSKRLTQQYRPVLADNRASAGFRLSTKEAVYPIVGKRSKGARMWDVDGNEYIDFTMGFGANLFGHSPEFVIDEMRSQIDEGFQLGPQSELAGVVASGIAELTGHERVSFCNSGSEAVMTAVRLARTVTRRSKIAIFSGSYHGTFDGVLARSRVVNGMLATQPAAPGTPQSFVEQEVMVLEYGDDESLRLLGENAQSLAAVIVEPVQSRHPAKQPTRFLKELRALTQACGVAMIWDETITGFRAAPGGAQEYFGVHGDIATYGKIIGGGMPIGIVAGSARYLNAIDGGVWKYGDDSYPKAEQTFFAGTFNKHPITLRTANAVLQRLRDAGPSLQGDLNQRTSALAVELNAFFQAQEIPIRIEHFSSLFRFAFSGNMDMLFMSLMHRGIYIWEGRNCFLSTAHTEGDVRQFIEQVKLVVCDLRDHGFFAAQPGSTATAAQASASRTLALSGSQRRFNRWSNAPGEEGVGQIAFALRLKGGSLNLQRLEAVFNTVIERHEALRSSVDPIACTQTVHTHAALRVACQDFSGLDDASRDAAVREWKTHQAHSGFDLSQPPLMRVSVARLGADESILHLTVHHTVCDGLSLAQILEEVHGLYRGESAGALPPSISLSEMLHEDAAVASNPDDQAYWMRHIESPPTLLTLCESATRSGSAGARAQVQLSASAVDAVKATAKRFKCTPFMLLCAAYLKLLASQTRNQDLLVGVPFLNTAPKRGEARVGCFVELMPLRVDIAPFDGLKQVAERVKELMLHGYRHALGLKRLPSVMFSATFNFEPRILPESFGNLAVEFEETHPQQIEFDVMLNVTETSQSFVVSLDFRHRALSTEEAAQWLNQYVEIIETGCGQGADSVLCDSPQRALTLSDKNQ